MTPHRNCPPRLIRLPVGRAANSPALHGSVVPGLFIPSQCVLPARDGGGVASSQGPAATYSARAA